MARILKKITKTVAENVVFRVLPLFPGQRLVRKHNLRGGDPMARQRKQRTYAWVGDRWCSPTHARRLARAMGITHYQLISFTTAREAVVRAAERAPARALAGLDMSDWAAIVKTVAASKTAHVDPVAAAASLWAGLLEETGEASGI